MRGHKNPMYQAIRAELINKKLKAKEIAEKYGCKLHTVYDISYRLRREAGLAKKKVGRKARKHTVLNKESAPRFFSYREHLQAELTMVHKQMETLQSVATFLSLRIKALAASHE